MSTFIEVGQTVFLEPYGNIGRGWRKDPNRVPFMGVVESIGRVYFYVRLFGGRVKFRLSDLKCFHEECNSGYKLWFSVDDWRRYEVFSAELRAVCGVFRNQSPTMLEDLPYDVVHYFFETLSTLGYISGG